MTISVRHRSRSLQTEVGFVRPGPVPDIRALPLRFWYTTGATLEGDHPQTVTTSVVTYNTWSFTDDFSGQATPIQIVEHSEELTKADFPHLQPSLPTERLAHLIETRSTPEEERPRDLGAMVGLPPALPVSMADLWRETGLPGLPPASLSELAELIGVSRREFNLEGDKLTQVGEGLFARIGKGGGIELYRVLSTE